VSTDPSRTILTPQARHDRVIEAFGGSGYQATTPAQVTIALTRALLSGGPALVDCVIDPTDGTERGDPTQRNGTGVRTN
jgi:oxalyl-CoA decarboxylase